MVSTNVNNSTTEPEPDLLPPNATPLERSLSVSAGRIGQIPLELLDIWDPLRCPREFLPWLAWATSLDIWQEQWLEGVHRTLVSESVPLQKSKGSKQAIVNAVRWILALTIDPQRESLDNIEKQLDGTFVVREWWEEAEGAPRGTPYSFEVRLLLGALLSATGVLEGTLYSNLRSAIDAVKPVTSRYVLTVGGLEFETQKGVGTMARAVHMARFTATLE